MYILMNIEMIGIQEIDWLYKGVVKKNIYIIKRKKKLFSILNASAKEERKFKHC